MFLVMWLAGFLACLGIYFIFRDQWKVENESVFKYYFRVILVCSLSWLGVGITIGRIAWVVRDILKALNDQQKSSSSTDGGNTSQT